MRTNVAVDKNSPEYLAKQVASGRYSLLLVVIFTTVNLLFLLLNVDRYFLFSASVPFYMTLICKSIDNGFSGSLDATGTFTIIALVISVVILGLYLLCWIMSKKRSGWLTAALVLFVLDTVALLAVTVLLLGSVAENLMDYLFHAWAIFSLVQAISANGKLKKLQAEAMITPEGYHGTTPEL